MRSDFFVVSTPVTDGERFAILRRETMATGPFLWSLLPEDWRRAFDSYVKGAGLLMEDQVRAQLAEMGLSSDAVDDQIGALVTSRPSTRRRVGSVRPGLDTAILTDRK